MAKVTAKLRDGISVTQCTNLVQKQVLQYELCTVYCVQYGSSIKMYIIEEGSYPMLQYIGYIPREYNHDDLKQIIVNSCSFSVKDEFLASNIDIQFL